MRYNSYGIRFLVIFRPHFQPCMLKTNTRFQKESVSEEQAQENGNTARAFVNGVWVDDNEKFACEYSIDLHL